MVLFYLLLFLLILMSVFLPKKEQKTKVEKKDPILKSKEDNSQSGSFVAIFDGDKSLPPVSMVVDITTKADDDSIIPQELWNTMFIHCLEKGLGVTVRTVEEEELLVKIRSIKNFTAQSSVETDWETFIKKMMIGGQESA